MFKTSVSTLFVVVAALAFVYVVFCALLFVGQRNMLYLPPPGAPAVASHVVWLEQPGARVQVSAHKADSKKAIIYFGGNGEDVSHNLPLLRKSHPQRALYLMHYRGYAKSTGSPTQTDLFADALALFDHVKANHPDIIVVGRSLGSGVATYLASERMVSSLVLITPYDSVANVAARAFPFVPVNWLLKDKYESWRYAASVKARTVFLVAQRDEMIATVLSRRLFERFTDGLARWHLLDGAGHNDISNHPDFLGLFSELR